jgi:hypothetical protein
MSPLTTTPIAGLFFEMERPSPLVEFINSLAEVRGWENRFLSTGIARPHEAVGKLLKRHQRLPFLRKTISTLSGSSS